MGRWGVGRGEGGGGGGMTLATALENQSGRPEARWRPNTVSKEPEGEVGVV